MAEQRLNGMRVAILATDYFEQVEMTKPRKALEEAGASTTLISPKEGSIQGVHHMDPGDKFEVEMQLKDARADQFDGVLLPGGAVNADHLRMEEDAREFVRRISSTGKPIAVICHGPWLLVSAGLLGGRTITSYYTIQDDIRNAGANWVDREVVRDGLMVSSRNPDDIPAFNDAMIRTFHEAREARRNRPETQQARDEQRA